MDELEKQLHEMLVEEARNIFEMLLKNGDMNHVQFENIQKSVVDANRTADTIQVILQIFQYKIKKWTSFSNQYRKLISILTLVVRC